MKKILFSGIIIFYCVANHQMFAQGYGAPLTIQGLNHTSVHSVASRSAGGISIGLTNNASLMFSNPAALNSIEGLQLSLGGVRNSWDVKQTQQWLPLRYIPTFSLMMEGLLDSIPNPDLSETPEGGFGPEDSIPRAYDNIKPNWSRAKQKNVPIQFFAAMPFDLDGIKVVGGVGVVEYADLNYYFQNNNVLSPSIGTQRPYGVPLPGIGVEVPVLWSQYSQSRSGSLKGYGGALSINISEKLAFGVSGLFLNGKTDDVEYSQSRGRLRFGNNNSVYYYKIDSLYSRTTKTGTSEFSGTEISFSSSFQSRYLILNLNVKPSSTITRKYHGAISIDTTGSSSTSLVDAQDKITLPVRGSAGLALMVRQNFTIGIEYELLPYADAEYKNVSGVKSKPWLSSSVMRFGAEFLPMDWFVLRAGLSQNSEVFEQEGNALVGDPVKYSIYSFGIGVMMANIRLNVGYEYSELKYQDMWQTNVNLTTDKRSNIVADIAYTLK